MERCPPLSGVSAREPAVSGVACAGSVRTQLFVRSVLGLVVSICVCLIVLRVSCAVSISSPRHRWAQHYPHQPLHTCCRCMQRLRKRCSGGDNAVRHCGCRSIFRESKAAWVLSIASRQRNVVYKTTELAVESNWHEEHGLHLPR